MVVGFTEPTTEEDRLGGHLARLEVDEFLETKGDDVGRVDGGEHVGEEADVLGAAAGLVECVGFGGVDVPGNDENVEGAVCAEGSLPFDELVVCPLYVSPGHYNIK